MEAIQLELGFETGLLGGAELAAVEAPPPEIAPRPANGPDAKLAQWCAQAACDLGLPRLARRVDVIWNGRLQTTAGQADCRDWRIELNPRLVEFAPVEPGHTLRHELAHLVAQARAGRRRIGTHGPEWREACADLGIPGEKACHNLPLPRRKMERKWAYRCAACGTVFQRVRRIRYTAACADCCGRHNRGRFSKRFLLVEAALVSGR